MSENELIELILGGSVILILILLVLVIGYLVLYFISLSKLFKKAGKKGWEAIVPFYSTYVLIEIAGLNWWYFLIAIFGSLTVSLEIEGFVATIANLASIAVNLFIFYNLAKKMHKEPWPTAILGTLFSGIMVPVLGLSKSYEYDSSVAVSPNGPIGEEKNNSNNTTPERFCLGCGQKLRPNSSFCENCGKKID